MSFIFQHLIQILFNFFISYRIHAPELPTWQDCHELWSKKRRRQQREQQESSQKTSKGDGEI